MKSGRLLGLVSIVVVLLLAAGIGIFAYDAKFNYHINNGFTSIPLQYDPENGSSTLEKDGQQLTVHGGFIKGVQKLSGEKEAMVVRALSPLPSIEVKGTNDSELTILLENINPEFYAKQLNNSSLSTKITMARISLNSLELKLKLKQTNASDGSITLKPILKKQTDSAAYGYIILGDNRDGYDTFGKVIDQANGEKPVLVIDNGDLVFSGKPNQYRLFDKMVSKLSSTLCTVPGNHDIRGTGRELYTRLYGPAYYSFDFADSHFVFLDSSPGWTEKRAISEEQYSWLEKDLKKTNAKHILVITHIPPVDPRSGVKKNEIPNYVSKTDESQSWLEQKLDNYSESKSMDHGFQDPIEASRFEKLMSAFHVETVYLSHIHSHLEYTKDGVRYLISGGAGAELLTTNSYYHYMLAKIDDSKQLTMVELPSPPNSYISRYTATAALFAEAIYDENPLAVSFLIAGLVALAVLLLLWVYVRRKHTFNKLGRWIADTIKYSISRFKELFGRGSN